MQGGAAEPGAGPSSPALLRGHCAGHRERPGSPPQAHGDRPGMPVWGGGLWGGGLTREGMNRTRQAFS